MHVVSSTLDFCVFPEAVHVRIIFNHMAACRGHRPLCAFYVHLVCRDCCSLSVHTRSSCPCVGIFQRAPALSGCLCSVQHLAVRSSPQGGSLFAHTGENPGGSAPRSRTAGLRTTCVFVLITLPAAAQGARACSPHPHQHRVFWSGF